MSHDDGGKTLKDDDVVRAIGRDLNAALDATTRAAKRATALGASAVASPVVAQIDEFAEGITGLLESMFGSLEPDPDDEPLQVIDAQGNPIPRERS